MAATAEMQSQFQEQITSEEYAHSLTPIRNLGSIAVHGELPKLRESAAYEEVFADFVTAVAEMQKTDQEFRAKLDIDNVREQRVVDNMVRRADGTPMMAVLENGVKSSQQAAESQPELVAQVVRDECDVEEMKAVDQLLPGQTRLSLSMDPKNELKKHKDVFTSLGYKEGLAYMRLYTRVDEDTLVAGSYSVDMSNEASWRELFAELGINIPEGESLNTWVRYGLVFNATAEEAGGFAKAIRNEYYKRCGSEHSRLSVSEYVRSQSEVIRKLYETYYMPLAEAVYTGRNNNVLSSFAHTLLQKDTKDLDPTIMTQLLRIANLKTFDDEAGKTMDSVIRYAVVEELRKGLSAYEQGSTTTTVSPVGRVLRSDYASMDPAQVNQLLASNVEVGIRAHRSYGGCAGQIKLNGRDGLEENLLGSLQEAFGGKDDDQQESRKWTWKRGICRVEACSTRPGETEVGPCSICRKCQVKFDAGKDPTKTKVPLFSRLKKRATQLVKRKPKQERQLGS